MDGQLCLAAWRNVVAFICPSVVKDREDKETEGARERVRLHLNLKPEHKVYSRLRKHDFDKNQFTSYFHWL